MEKTNLAALEEKLLPPVLDCPKCSGDLEGTIWPLGFESANGDSGYQIMFICTKCRGVWQNPAESDKTRANGTK